MYSKFNFLCNEFTNCTFDVVKDLHVYYMLIHTTSYLIKYRLNSNLMHNTIDYVDYFVQALSIKVKSKMKGLMT